MQLFWDFSDQLVGSPFGLSVEAVEIFGRVCMKSLNCNPIRENTQVLCLSVDHLAQCRSSPAPKPLPSALLRCLCNLSSTGPWPGAGQTETVNLSEPFFYRFWCARSKNIPGDAVTNCERAIHGIFLCNFLPKATLRNFVYYGDPETSKWINSPNAYWVSPVFELPCQAVCSAF